MILFQFSAGQGPAECALAVGYAVNAFTKACARQRFSATLIESSYHDERELSKKMIKVPCYKSVLFELDADCHKMLLSFLMTWQGPLLWVHPSPFRPKHKRKNWYFSGTLFTVDTQHFDETIIYKTCRASGAGGQHVNTTDSAVHAIHQASGISVKVHTERSQHANKKLAKARLLQKLASLQEAKYAAHIKSHWQQHWNVERGNPVKIFKGAPFNCR